MQDFRNLKVWQKAHELALLTYKLTADFPREETFGLRHSLRKTAVDIPAYIAEGAAKANDKEFAASVNYALSLAKRLEYYALMASDLDFFEAGQYRKYNDEIVEVQKMLAGFKRRLVDE
jgi:four helix bundle protein